VQSELLDVVRDPHRYDGGVHVVGYHDGWRILMTEELSEQLRMMFDEIDGFMDTLPGNIDRIKDCSLREQWRTDHGWAFDGSGDDDNHIWKGSYDIFEEGEEEYLPFFIKSYMTPCGLEKLTVLVKYPAVAERLIKAGVWK